MEKQYTFEEFMDIIRHLRSEDGCPWDKVQTHESLQNCMLEEAYESVEAIRNNDLDNLCEELGDVMLQVALHSAIAEGEKEFTVQDVINGVSNKMIRRHPHVFGTGSANSAEEVVKTWDEIKKKEKHQKVAAEGLVSIPKALPALIRAEKVQKKAEKEGLYSRDYDTVIDEALKVLNELKECKVNGGLDSLDEKFGKLLFHLVNLSGFLQLNAENSLTNATNKFINRFVDVERLAREKAGV